MEKTSKRKRKILYVCRSPILPGTVVETHVLGVASAWKEAGHEVTVWTPLSPADPRLDWRPLSFGRFSSFSTSGWRRGIAQATPDFVYSRWCVSEGPALASACDGLGVPCFVEINGILAEEMPGASATRRAWVRWAQVRTLRGCAGGVVPTEGVRRHLLSASGAAPERVRVVENGVDTALLTPLDRLECRKRLGLAADAPCLVFVGSFQPWHGVETLVRAFAEATGGRPDARLLLVGDGPRVETARGLAGELGCSDRILWAGAVSREEVPLWIGASDAAACLWEPVRSDPGSSVKLFEYMACARPAIASDVPGYAAHIRRSSAGWLAGIGDPGSVAAAIRHALAAPPEERVRMGSAARDYAMMHCTWRRAADRILAFMEEKR